MQDNILASAIAKTPHLAVFDEIERTRFADLDLTALMIYFIETVPAEALPYLAAQFDITGIKGYGFVSTEADQRAVIKRAIDLHRHKGTPYAIRESLRAIGYPVIEIYEGATAYYNSEYLYNSTIGYGGTEWATFSVDLILPNMVQKTPAEGMAVYRTIQEYKNSRSKLIGFNFIYSNGYIYSFNHLGQPINNGNPNTPGGSGGAISLPVQNEL